MWMERQLRQNKDIVNEILSQNTYVKQKFNEVLSRKKENNNKEKLSYDEWKKTYLNIVILTKKCL
jgi:hypothetical protein